MSTREGVGSTAGSGQTSDKYYVCKDCPMTTKFTNEYYKHIRYHNPNRVQGHLKCPHCNFTCSWAKVYECHAQLHRKAEAKQNIADTKRVSVDNNNASGRPAASEEKATIAPTATSEPTADPEIQSLTHEQFYEEEEKEDRDVEENPITQQIISAAMSDEVDLYRMSSCKYCPYRSTSSSITKHMKHHLISAKHTCDLCSYSTEYKAVLEKHRGVHSSRRVTKMSACKLCPYTADAQAILYHQKNHTNKSKFKCIYCTFSSPYRTVTVRHVQLHKKSGSGSSGSPTKASSLAFQKKKPNREALRKNIRSLKLKSKSKNATKGSPPAQTDRLFESRQYRYKCTLCPFATNEFLKLNHHRSCHSDSAAPDFEDDDPDTGGSEGDIKRKSMLLNGLNLMPTSLKTEMAGTAKMKVPDTRQSRMLANIVTEDMNSQSDDSAAPTAPPTKYASPYDHRGLLNKNSAGFWCRKCPFVTKAFAKFEKHYIHHERPFSHKCSKCSYSCVRLWTLERHLRLHKVPGSPSKKTKRLLGKAKVTALVNLSKQLKKFDEKDPVKKTLKRKYIRSVTDDSIRMSCTECPFVARSKTTWNMHRRHHHVTLTHTCKDCSFSTAYEEVLQRHAQVHAPQLEANTPSMKCPYCPFESEFYDMKNHLRHHTLRLKYKCDHCSYATMYQRVLMSHNQLHLNIKGFENKVEARAGASAVHGHLSCSECSFKCTSERAFLSHFECHTPDLKKLKCVWCDYKCIDYDDWMEHKKLHPPGPDPASPAKRNLAAGADETPEKKRKISAGSDEVTSDGMDDVTTSLGWKKRVYYFCDQCNYKSIESRKLELHHVYHTGQSDYPCPKCSFSTNIAKMLTIHLDYHYNEEEPIQCPECPYRTPHTALYTEHYTHHVGEREQKCSQCSWSGWSAGELSEHVQKDHCATDAPAQGNDVEMLLTCNKCPFKCLNKAIYASHLEHHITPRKFQCPNCSYSSNMCDTLARHMAVHRRQTNQNDDTPVETRPSSAGGHFPALTEALTNEESADEALGIIDDAVPAEYTLPDDDILEYWQVKCQFCNFNISRNSSKKSFDEHMEHHRYTRQHVCDTCSYSSDDLASIATHVQFMHREEDIPGTLTPASKPVCPKPQIPPTYNCPECPFRTCKKLRLKSHLKHHEGVYNHNCKDCSYTTDSFPSLRAHARVHNGAKYTGDFTATSNPSSATSDLTSDPVLDPTPNSPLTQCPHCPYESTSQKMMYHMKHHEIQFKVKCPYCTFSCGHQTPLILHLTEAHKIKGMESTGIESTKSPKLAKTSLSPSQIKKACPHCPFSTASKCKLRKHVSHHMAENLQTNRCPYCTYSASTSGGIGKHCASVHKEQFRESRPLAEQSARPKGLRVFSLLKKPNKLISIMNKKFRCPHCPFRTGKMWNLNKHITHHGKGQTGGKHECQLCDFRTGHLAGLIKHGEVHKERKYEDEEERSGQKWTIEDAEAGLIPEMDIKQEPIDGTEMFGTLDPSSALEGTLEELQALQDTLDILQGTTSRAIVGPTRQDILKKAPDKVRYCTQCPYSASTVAELNRHMLCHKIQGELRCSMCSFSTNRHPALGMHMKAVHKMASKRCITKAKSQARLKLIRQTDAIRKAAGLKPLSMSPNKSFTALLKQAVDAAKSDGVAGPVASLPPAYNTPYQHKHAGMVSHASRTPYGTARLKRRIQCPDCPHRTTDYNKLKQHIKHHQVTMALTCKLCTYSSGSPRVMANHLRVHKADLRGMGLSPDAKLHYHSGADVVTVSGVGDEDELLTYNASLTESDVTEGEETPRQAPKKSEEELSRWRHKRYIYACDNCSFRTNKKNRHEVHKAAHNANYAHKCTHCTYSCDYKQGLNMHLKMIHNVNFSMWKSTPKVKATHKVSLAANTVTIDGNAIPNNWVILDGVGLDEEGFLSAWKLLDLTGVRVECPHCPYSISMKNRERLFKHLQHHYMVGSHKCSLCSYNTMGGGALGKHEQLHNMTGRQMSFKPVRCSYCPFSTSNQVLLEDHTRHHTEKSLVTCHMCAYSCEQQHELSRHLQLHYMALKHGVKHVDEIKENRQVAEGEPFTLSTIFCHLCPYQTEADAQFQHHMTAHSLKYKHVCLFCTFGSDDTKPVQDHIDLHLVAENRGTPNFWFRGNPEDFGVTLEENQLKPTNTGVTVETSDLVCDRPMERGDAVDPEYKMEVDTVSYLQGNNKEALVPNQETDTEKPTANTGPADLPLEGAVELSPEGAGAQYPEAEHKQEGKPTVCPYCDVKLSVNTSRKHIQRHLLGSESLER